MATKEIAMYELYTRVGCVYCHRAKDLLAIRKKDYIEHLLEVDLSLEEVKTKFPNNKKLPIILEDGQMIGSYENLIDHLNPPLRYGEAGEN